MADYIIPKKKLDDLYKEVDTLKDSLKLRQDVCDTLRTAAFDLCVRLREIHDDELYKAVWTSAMIHGIDYTKGPTYVRQLENLEDLLSIKIDWKIC